MSRDPLQLRLATGLERRAALMLLPEEVRQRPWNDYWLAVSEKPLRIFGAVATFRSRAPDGSPQLHVDLHVAAPYRLRGIGRLMIDRLREEAVRRHTLSLVTSFDPLHSEGAREFLMRVGFEFADRFSTYEVDTRRLADYVLSLRDWLVGRGTIPTGARVVRLREIADLDAVAALHSDHLAGTREESRSMLRNLLAGPMADHHIGLLVDGRLAGLMLTETCDGFSEVKVTVVDPAFRAQSVGGGWANVLMMADRLEWGLGLGSRRCRFSCLTAARATHKLALHSGADCIAVADFYRLLLG